MINADPDFARERNGSKIADIRRCPSCCRTLFPGVDKCTYCGVDLMWQEHMVALYREPVRGIGKPHADDRMWYVYVVECSNGSYYTGVTKNVQARVAQHNIGKGSKAVKALGLPVKLRWWRPCCTKSHALKFEARLKALTHAQKRAWLNCTSTCYLKDL